MNAILGVLSTNYGAFYRKKGGKGTLLPEPRSGRRRDIGKFCFSFKTVRKEFLRKRRPNPSLFSDESGRKRCKMAIGNITSQAKQYASPQRQGAVIHSVATVQEYKVHYGVQSATFTRTVFPGQATGTYRINGMIPTWQGTKITASSSTGTSRPSSSQPIPYPPPNASAYYSSQHTRIIPNTRFSFYG